MSGVEKLIFDFSEAHRDGWSPTVRPPRLGGNTRVGVFASRSPPSPSGSLHINDGYGIVSPSVYG